MNEAIIMQLLNSGDETNIQMVFNLAPEILPKSIRDWKRKWLDSKHPFSLETFGLCINRLCVFLDINTSWKIHKAIYPVANIIKNTDNYIIAPIIHKRINSGLNAQKYALNYFKQKIEDSRYRRIHSDGPF